MTCAHYNYLGLPGRTTLTSELASDSGRAILSCALVKYFINQYTAENGEAIITCVHRMYCGSTRRPAYILFRSRVRKQKFTNDNFFFTIEKS